MKVLETSETTKRTPLKKKGGNKKISNVANKGNSASGRGHREEIPSQIPEYNDPIEILNLSHRSAKALKNAGITTVEELFNLSYQELYAVKNIGRKSADELLAWQSKLAGNGLQKKIVPEKNGVISLHDSISALNMSVRSTKALNNYGIYTIENFLKLDDQELYTIKNVGKKSIEEILISRNNTRKTAEYKDAFKCFDQQEQLKQLHKIFKNIPKFWLDKSFYDYLSCIHGLDMVVDKFRLMPDFIHTINDLPLVFELICKDDEKSGDFLLLLNLLAFDIKTSFNDMFEKIFSNKKHDRVLRVLKKRANGKTLQEISDEMALTRERIRQIENKGTKILVRTLNEIHLNLFAFINIENKNEDIITVKELEKYLNGVEHLDVFIYILKTKQIWENYTFDKRLNIFYNNTIIADINAILDKLLGLPNIVEEDKRDDILSQINRENNFPPKATNIVFFNIYKRSGRVYCKERLSLSIIYDYILEKYYPGGIKLFDDSIIEHFKRQILETFGSNKVPENNRAIYARIAKQAVLCDRGAYIHQKYIKIDKDLIEEIDRFIAVSPRRVLSFNELFETFKQKLLRFSNINNRYFLQGVLNIYLREKYFFNRDNISKGVNASFTDEIESYIKDKGEVTKAELFSEFHGVSQIVFSMRTKNNKNIIYIGNGGYMYVDRLKFEKDDYQIKNIIMEYVKKNPVSSRKMLELFQKTNPEFLANNAIKTHEKLFGILHFLFKDDFYFSRPYIAKFGTDEISNKSVIREYLKSYDSVTIPELLDLCEEHHLKYFSVRGLIKDLNDEFLRIDSHTLVRMNAEIDENVIIETAKLLSEKINECGFFAVSKFDDYFLFPKTDFEWNPFFLRSIVEKYMDDIINIIDIPTTDTYIMNSIFVDSQTETCSYESLLKNMFVIKNNHKPLKTKDEVIAWLKEEGLIIGNIPKCLFDESILSNDETGNLVIRQ
jgi:transcriptional regulator with XRE-family HTH domain